LKKNWVEEVKKRADAYCKGVDSALLLQRAVVSKHVRESFKLSKTQLAKLVYQHDAWLRGNMTKLSSVEVVLERWGLLGKFVWWRCERFVKRATKSLAMQKVDGTVPIEQREPPKGAERAVVDKTITETIPVA